ncbi:hypothetical protein LINGRAHAP2_LOCUS10988, partial [Linum grandiflorum]
GFSANRPPKLEGAHFGYWKNRMELFIKSFNPELWVLIVNGPKEVWKSWTSKSRLPSKGTCITGYVGR